ncbi:hypothetical protein CI109_102878 [Kwoniella shandongensis]|uniref:Uncharacterized protein n=1 Tax=Kwoniella shandongensis TaxID=1734106 RepID=A0A5M6C9D4_9TREE|nr:uncharacterized protein CI109_000068 [Kwoniella shandongensis]KAA5531230.1 hypothetical protein CI109_000068 [Kwoniella shandongensis]
MMGFKKKLTSLIPTDARSQLQNALTVEWEGGNKTVLVDLPGTGEKSNEVEMSGFGGANRGGDYGRLMDDDEDEGGYLRPSTQSQSRSRPTRDRSGSHDSREYSYSSKHTKSPSYSSKNLPPLPANKRTHSNNPFEPDFYATSSPQPSSSSTYTNSPYTGTSNASPHFSHHQQPSFSGDAGYAMDFNDSSRRGGEGGSGGYAQRERKNGTSRNGNPWATFRADDVDLLGDLGVSSPSSSRGTRDSAGSSVENPFR